MSRRLPRSATALAVVVGALASAPSAPAQVVVVTARSASALIDDLRYLAGAIAVDEDARPMLEALDKLKEPDALQGLDRSKPFGAYLDLPKQPGEPPSVVAFVPITDAKAFFKTLEQAGFGVDAEPGVPGFSHKVTPPGDGGQALFALSTKDHAIFSLVPTGADQLRTLDPAGLLPSRPDAGKISLSVRLDRIPAQYKDMVLAQMKENVAKQKDRRPDENDVQYQGRLTGLKLAQDATTRVVRDGRELTLDLSIDQKRAEVVNELGLAAAPGTPFADAMRTFGARRSIFRGLDKGAAVGAWADLPVAEAIRDVFARSLEQARRDAEEKEKDPVARQLAAKVLDAIKPTLTGDEADLGFGIYGPFPKADADPTFVFLVGLKVRDGAKLDRVLRDAIREAKPEDKAEVTLDAAKAGDGTPIHRIRSEPKDKNAAMFGEPFVFVAFREDVALAAAGENGLSVLKQALDATRRPSAGFAPAQADLRASASKIAHMGTGADREAMKAAAAEIFKGKDAARDNVHLTLRGAGDALRLRLTTDVPALRFFALVGARQQKKAGAQP